MSEPDALTRLNLVAWSPFRSRSNCSSVRPVARWPTAIGPPGATAPITPHRHRKSRAPVPHARDAPTSVSIVSGVQEHRATVGPEPEGPDLLSQGAHLRREQTGGCRRRPENESDASTLIGCRGRRWVEVPSFEKHLGAAEHGDLPAAHGGSSGDDGVPDLGCTAAMMERGDGAPLDARLVESLSVAEEARTSRCHSR